MARSSPVYSESVCVCQHPARVPSLAVHHQEDGQGRRHGEEDGALEQSPAPGQTGGHGRGQSTALTPSLIHSVGILFRIDLERHKIYKSGPFLTFHSLTLHFLLFFHIFTDGQERVHLGPAAHACPPLSVFQPLL